MVELDYKKICRKVSFPVYPVSHDNIYYEDGILFKNGKVLDDRNQPGETLGVRRLQTPHKVARLTTAVLDFTALLDCKSLEFIDSKGFCFRYKKTKLCRIESFKINKKISKGTHTILMLKGINSPFSINYFPFGKEWAQVLMLDKLPWKLLGVSEDKLSTYKRKI